MLASACVSLRGSDVRHVIPRCTTINTWIISDVMHETTLEDRRDNCCSVVLLATT